MLLFNRKKIQTDKRLKTDQKLLELELSEKQDIVCLCYLHFIWPVFFLYLIFCITIEYLVNFYLFRDVFAMNL